MSKVPGSLFRRTLFWAHLTAGIAAGIIILVMSVTGVLLTYESQVLEWAGARNHLAAVPTQSRLSADRIAELAQAAPPQAARASLRFDADPTAPVTVVLPPIGSILLNPYTGAIVEDAASGFRQFFRVVRIWHRWLGGPSQSTRATLVDISNLLFLFIVASGIYLWLPTVWRWPVLRRLMFFSPRYVNAKARDFAWHHVFSVWALVPLFLVVLSGVVMSFNWANNLVYAAYGEQAPQRRGQGGGGGEGAPAPEPRGRNALGQSGGQPFADRAERASLESLLVSARASVENWQGLTLPMSSRDGTVSIAAELKSKSGRAPRQTLLLSASDASVIALSAPQGNSQQSPGQRARSWFRNVHTGEQYGVAGQTLAGLASLAACFLVYTGWALAWRRLVVPPYRRLTAIQPRS